MADKTQFHTIETDEEELNTKIRKHRLKIILLLLALAAVVALGIFFFQKLRKYNSYTVEKSVERQDTAGSRFLAYGNGFIKYSNDGAIYTDANDEVYWNQTYEMKEPMADVCEDYVALADKGGTEIYIMNQAGMQGKIETPMNISGISVANQGVVAVWMESDGENYIRMYDKNGKNLVSGAFYTEKSGYPLDISLCNDGKKLAVSMLTVNNGEVCSTIKCYNFGSVGQNEIDYMVGSFDYPDVIIPQIEFTDNNRLVAFGDSKIILFSGTQKPEPDDEIALNQEIKSVFTSENYILVLSHDEVVHLKCSMINKMPGLGFDKYANLKAGYAFMMGHAGKKLLFMGQDFAQLREWSEERELDWYLLEEPEHQAIQSWMRDLLHMYKKKQALYELDQSWEGFEWVNADDAYRSIYSFIRHSKDGKHNLLFVINFTPMAREDYRVGVPRKKQYKLILNSDDVKYGGNGEKRQNIYHAVKKECDGRPYSFGYKLPPYGVAVFEF